MGGQLWEVVGGGKAGGIVVRQGEGLQSPQLPDRLAQGAVVAEEKLVGERLSFKKVSGDGPDKGWVSLKLKGANLLEKKEAPPPPAKKEPAPPPELSRDEALGLQRELHDGFKDEAFQSTLKALKAKHPEGGRQFNMERSKLYSSVQTAVIPKYGFEANAKGVFLMGQILTHWSNKDPEIGQLGFKINLLLDPPPAPKPPAGADDFPPPGDFDTAWLPPLPEGQVPDRLNAFGMDSIANLRDVAGVDPARPRRVAGGRLKRGLLFRTASWTTASEEDVNRLQSVLGIKTYFDLRQGRDAGVEGADGSIWDAYPPSPSGRHGDMELPPAGSFRRLHFNFARNTGFRQLSDEEQVNKIPQDDLKRQTNLWFQLELQKTFAEGFSADKLEKHLAVLNACILFANDDVVLAAMKACTEPDNYPVAFGCMTGKDRTGLMSMLVLAALGASKEEIMEDYLLTNLAAAHNSEVIVRNYQVWEEQKAAMIAAWQEEERRRAAEAAAAAGEAPEASQEAAPAEDASAQPQEASQEEAPAEEAPAQPQEASPSDEASAPAQEAPQEAPSADGASDPAQPQEGGESADKPPDTGSIASNEDNLKAAKVFRVVMEYTLHVLEQQAGGVANYLNSIGFGPEDVAKLREILVEPEEQAPAPAPAASKPTASAWMGAMLGE